MCGTTAQSGSDYGRSKGIGRGIAEKLVPLGLWPELNHSADKAADIRKALAAVGADRLLVKADMASSTAITQGFAQAWTWVNDSLRVPLFSLLLMNTTSSLQPLSAAELHAVRSLYQAFSDNNPDLVDQAVTPTWQDIPLGPGQAPGPDGIKPIIAQFRRAFPDLTIIIHEIMGSAGRAAVRAEIRGTHQGEWFGIAATNRLIRMPLHEFHHLENGRITHTWHLEDWFGMFHQLGTLPPSL